ncbi:HvfC/BufC family peptide modification chaperone [Cupriavidus sp. RAF12]|uniref:HvfC/BufC family peptide modification chaperone n=1 Tax=Cupriavidus sp. RAF12 TaxID=3233050 RepID=UPI003F92E21E
MSLAALQQDFQAWLTRSSPVAARRLRSGAAPGLAVYQNNYRAQLVGCLESSYPVVREWLGDETFVAAAIAHINTHPPYAWTLDAYADDFGETLVAHYPDNPDLHELAWIELALSQAFVAADAVPISAQDLADLDWDAAQLRLTPSLMMRTATTNAEQIWTAMRNGAPTPEGEMLEAPGGLIVWRRDFSCFLRHVDAVERDALLHLQQNGSFSELCDHLVQQLGDVDGIARAGALLADWVSNGLIVGVTLD